MKGVGPVKDVEDLGISKGLSEDWYSSDSIQSSNRNEIHHGDFWSVKDNPLYEAAAGLGMDWDSWVKNAESTAVSGSTRVRAMIRKGGLKDIQYLADRYANGNVAKLQAAMRGRPRKSRSHYYEPDEYEWMTKDQATARGLSYQSNNNTTLRWRNKRTGQIHTGIDVRDPWGTVGNRYDDDEWVKIRDWSVTSGDVAQDLEKMSSWLNDIITVNDHLHPIIREGPKGEHYGIAGDIWEHYGLDQEPEPPKELDWDSYDKKMWLNRTVKSNVSYSTPKGLQKVNLHGG